MDRILIILKKENGPRASSAPALWLNTIIFKYVYWYMKQISGERLQDHWSSGLRIIRKAFWPGGYKTFFMLSSAETKIYPAHKCLNANICDLDMKFPMIFTISIFMKK